MKHDDWAMTDEEEAALDAEIFEEKPEQPQDGWKHFVISVPEDFFELMNQTIDAYKRLRETDKTFPAIEAIFMEARNSLPSELLEPTKDSG